MCHGFDARDWAHDIDEEAEDDAEDDPASTPSFMQGEPAEDVEILTDGGDDE